MKKVTTAGIIIDGNRRWAVGQGILKTNGHTEGAKTVLRSIDWLRDENIENIIFYAFSMENWNRPKLEVKALLLLFEKMFFKEIDKILEKKVAVKFVGTLEKFPKSLQKKMLDLEQKTRKYEMKVFFAVSYGGRDEIVNAVKKLSEELTKKEIEKLTEKKFEKYLQSFSIPEPEIIIRTGGDKRLSNFLLWKSAYSELFFVDTLWPDFSKREIKNILKKFYLKARVNKGK